MKPIAENPFRPRPKKTDMSSVADLILGPDADSNTAHQVTDAETSKPQSEPILTKEEQAAVTEAAEEIAGWDEKKMQEWFDEFNIPHSAQDRFHHNGDGTWTVQGDLILDITHGKDFPPCISEIQGWLSLNSLQSAQHLPPFP